jgi:hypothetical protein
MFSLKYSKTKQRGSVTCALRVLLRCPGGCGSWPKHPAVRNRIFFVSHTGPDKQRWREVIMCTDMTMFQHRFCISCSGIGQSRLMVYTCLKAVPIHRHGLYISRAKFSGDSRSPDEVNPATYLSSSYARPSVLVPPPP